MEQSKLALRSRDRAYRPGLLRISRSPIADSWSPRRKLAWVFSVLFSVFLVGEWMDRRRSNAHLS
jgi:hypothetical protein